MPYTYPDKFIRDMLLHRLYYFKLWLSHCQPIEHGLTLQHYAIASLSISKNSINNINHAHTQLYSPSNGSLK